ncbi:MAG: aminodeoxychorismate synthase component I [Pseudomonadota bacterium]
MTPACFALLDDAGAASATPASRLYTGHTATLLCHGAHDWPALLERMRAGLARGQFAVTLFDYELGPALLGWQSGPRAGRAAPLARVLLFQRCRRLSGPQVARWLERRAGAQPAGVARVQAAIGRAEFDAALARIHAYIEAGDTYQINYTYRLRFDAYGSLFALYARLRARQPVPYGALVGFNDGSAVLSLSPELFVRHAGGALTAQPMKGTAPAAAPGQTEEDARRAAALAADPKNRAENLMIVDLLRNDIGRVAVTGTVSVPALFEVRRYSDVLQMTSTVRARLRPDADLAQLFAALYPCGSITGAPKRRSMEIIAQLEPDARGIYTGAIGWFDPPREQAAPGDFCMSVPIRTLALQAPRGGVRAGEMGVGAGIVFDSDAGAEWAECRLKARFLTGLTQQFALFETLHASRAEGCRHRARHLARLAASAAYFGFAFDPQAACAALERACAALTADTAFRLRLTLEQNGALNVHSAALTALTQPVGLLLAERPTDSDALFLRHKSTVRARYDQAWQAAEARGGFDTLFFNERDELTEGGRSSVFVHHGGHWLTPPLGCGLLPGVMRRVLLDDRAWDAREQVITRRMLLEAEQIVVCNALRGPLRAVLMPATPAAA